MGDIMSRKIQYISILWLAFSSYSFASGFYMGLGVGPDTAKFETNATIRQSQQGRISFNVKDKNQLSGAGLFGTLFAGYSKIFKVTYAKPDNILLAPNFYLAGELNANASSLEHTSSNNEYVHKNFNHTKFQIRRNFGASLLPGMIFAENTLFYGRLGYANGNFKITSSDISIGNLNKNLNGFRWGLGLQQSLYPQVAIRLEYSQIIYDSTHTSTLDRNSNTAKYTKFNPTTNQFEFGLVYHFC